MTRTRYVRTLGAASIAVLFGLTACGDDASAIDASVNDSGFDGSAVSCIDSGTLVDIVDNHRLSGGDHVLVIGAQDVIDGAEKTYDIRGDNVGHTHTVTLTAADFALLQAATPVTVISSSNGSAGSSHTHEVVISCAP